MSKLLEQPVFTKHEVERIYSVTMRIKNKQFVPTWEFDGVIRLLDKKEADLSFEKLFTYARYYSII